MGLCVTPFIQIMQTNRVAVGHIRGYGCKGPTESPCTLKHANLNWYRASDSNDDWVKYED